MEPSEKLYEIMFEISNEDRHKILISLQNSNANLTQISNILDLKLSETRRHLSRLTEVKLVERKPDGSYRLTNYGEQILTQVENIKFFTENKEYFQTHSVKQIPREFQGRLGDLSISDLHSKMMNYLKEIEDVINYSTDNLNIIVDELPFTIISSIDNAIKRGVTIKIISKELESTEREKLAHIFASPKVSLRTIDTPGVMLIVSNLKTAISFPNMQNRFTYHGFISKNVWALNWSKELFQKLWQQAAQKSHLMNKLDEEKKIQVIGHNDPNYDLRAVQDAVDNFYEVSLFGVFNFGNKGVKITKDCIVKGIGNENGVPSTKIYKTGWQIPFTSEERLILIKGKDISVSIENIHFSDFNGICVEANEGHFFSFKRNRITLETGFSRGRRHPYGDIVVGVFIGNWAGPVSGQKTFPGGVEIKENYLDFATSYRRGGYISPLDKWEDPNYHPDLHEEYYIGSGFFFTLLEGQVSIDGNIIRNMNMTGIEIQDCLESAIVEISNNDIFSDVYGSHIHWYSSHGDACYGIVIHSMASFEGSESYSVNIWGNSIKINKPNCSGINVNGPFNRPFNSDVPAVKFLAGSVYDNKIYLENGSVGIKVGRSDNIEICENEISGSAYYGIKVHGKGWPNDEVIMAENNQILRNRFSNLTIKPPDDFSATRADGVLFSSNDGTVNTGHIWLDECTKGNLIEILGDEKIIDEGINNKVTHAHL